MRESQTADAIIIGSKRIRLSWLTRDVPNRSAASPRGLLASPVEDSPWRARTSPSTGFPARRIQCGLDVGRAAARAECAAADPRPARRAIRPPRPRHSFSCIGLVAIRDSRIASILCKWLTAHGRFMFSIRKRGSTRSRVGYECGASGRIFPKARRRCACRSRSEPCRSGSKLELRRAALRAPR